MAEKFSKDVLRHIKEFLTLEKRSQDGRPKDFAERVAMLIVFASITAIGVITTGVT